MSDKFKLYLNDSYEFTEDVPVEGLIADVQVKDKEYFGNYHTSFFPTDADGKELVFNGWSLREFYVNRQWSKSYILRLIVSRDGLTYVDLGELVWAQDRKEGKTWWNNSNARRGLESEMFRRSIEFLNSVPNGIVSRLGVELFLEINACLIMADLLKFYQRFSGSFSKLTVSEIEAINEIFVEKWKGMV